MALKLKSALKSCEVISRAGTLKIDADGCLSNEDDLNKEAIEELKEQGVLFDPDAPAPEPEPAPEEAAAEDFDEDAGEWEDIKEEPKPEPKKKKASKKKRSKKK